MKGTLVLLGAVILGNYIAERFVLRAPGSSSGFVDIADGVGMDDVARGGVIVGTVLLARKFVG